MKHAYFLGLDIGSTTAKAVLTDDSNQVIFSRYRRHNAHVGEVVGQYLEELKQQIGDAELRLCVTGSVGMQTAESLGAQFLQEVVAAAVYAKTLHPEAKALIDIGGEDAKVVLFQNGNTELRMNGNCAGGTGAFLDQMSVLLGVDGKGLDELALQHTRLYPMAARCGVFAKTDVQNLLSRNLPKSDIAASILHSVAVQTVTTLAHGCSFTPPLLLCGGPLTFMPSLRNAFADYLHLSDSDFIYGPQSNLIPAMGCALRAKTDEKCLPVSLGELQEQLCKEPAKTWHSEMQPLFRDKADHEQWLKQKLTHSTEIKPMRKGLEQVTLGIDSGSTTTKVIARRLSGETLFAYYAPNLGDPIKAVTEGLQKLSSEARKQGAELRVMASCSTGYGEELIKAAFNLDEGIIETMAHYRAAREMEPDVSFILDIGGQDMKAIFVDQGAVVRMELNEACSSGCGTFIQTFASGLGYKVQDFASLACASKAPCDLGTRCTVFMNSKVKQVLREGAGVEDISAGLAYSVVHNCLYKVLKLHGNDSLGKHVVVQGGTMRNDSVVRAFELLTNTTVSRSNMPEMMGAMGCAIHAQEQLKDLNGEGRTIEQLLQGSRYTTRSLHCHGCENQCQVCQYTFGEGRKFYSGNKCERVFNNNGRDALQGQNIYPLKYKLLFDRDTHKDKGRRRIGIPQVLNQYEDYPFWHALLTEAGFEPVLSGKSDFRGYEAALGSVMSDNICFPAKLVHSHIARLEELHVERILMPYVVYEHNDDERTINSYNCPIVSGYSDVIRSAMEPTVPIDNPIINFSSEKLLRPQLHKYLEQTLGVSKQQAGQAITAAIEAQRKYGEDIRRENERILREGRAAGHLIIMLAGRPYHSDPLIQHKLSEMVAALGVDVISDDIVRGNTQTGAGDTYLVKQWAYMNRIIKAGQWAATQGQDVHFVQMTSFGCGPDAFIQDEVRDILQRHGKPYTLLKIDDVSNTGSLKLRVRSLIESLRMHGARGRERSFETTRTFRKSDQRRKILAPYFTEYLTPLLPSLLKLAGMDLEVLPESDQESARLGLEFGNNEVCYPATLIVGDIVKALRSGRYDLKNTAVVMTQTGGQCRATNYAGLIKRAMIANGFQDVPLITVGVATNAGEENEQEGVHIPWAKYASVIITSLFYCDTIAKMYYAAVVRESFPGSAAKLRDQYLKDACPAIEANKPKELLRLIEKAAGDFDRISLDRETKKVGIVGEIFLKFNHFAHQQLTRQIVSRGIEVVPPLISPFFIQEFVNVMVQRHEGLSCSTPPDFVVKGLYKFVSHRMRQVNRRASRFRYFRPFTDIYEDARGVNGIVSLAAQFGEGWLLPADIVSLVKSGVKDVVSLQPFGCIANHVVSKGIERRLQRDYPQLNLLSLDFDSGVSALNVTNRLLLFLDNVG